MELVPFELGRGIFPGGEGWELQWFLGLRFLYKKNVFALDTVEFSFKLWHHFKLQKVSPYSASRVSEFGFAPNSHAHMLHTQIMSEEGVRFYSSW